MKNKKIIASFELTLMIVSLFAFAHGIYLTDGSFKELKDRYMVEKERQSMGVEQSQSDFVGIIGLILDKIKEPMIPTVSAQEAGCCSIADTGEKCLTATEDVCPGQFAEGSLCDSTSFCRKGCCFDKSAGIYDTNVLEFECSADWVDDPNCNMPEAKPGCCVLGDTSFFETEGQCEVRTLSFAQGSSSIVDWRNNFTELQCLVLSATENEGACILQNGDCIFETEAQCYGHSGNFNEDFLCTSPTLNTSCQKTMQTTCITGKDKVYFVDSCGNKANVYDSNRADSLEYWDKVLPPEEICGNQDTSASANSPSCGNCNRFFDSICGPANENNFNVDFGNLYCKDLSCMVNGVKYKNGESWCVYDGAIGSGDDVVGSRHWKYVCSQGEINVEPCADYRNQICIQSDTKSASGNTEFRNAACVANNWRECITLNGDDGPGECANTLNCMVQPVNIADHFSFDVCVPKYPGGFSLNNERYQKTAEGICGLATQTCTVVYAPNTWGGCHIAANAACGTPIFYEKMNEFCRKLGDCGAEVNVMGKYSYGDVVTGRLRSEVISSLKNLANPIPGQFADVEDYSKYLGATGQWVNPEEAPDPEEPGDMTSGIGTGLKGVSAIAVAVKAGVIMNSLPGIGIFGATKLAVTGTTVTSSVITPAAGGAAIPAGSTISGGAGGALTSTGAAGTTAAPITGTGAGTAPASAAGFAGAAIGAVAGFYVGSMLAAQLGLSPGGSMLMAIGGAMVGAVAGYAFIYGLAALGPVGWIIAIIGIVLMVIASFFGGADCPPVDVRFTCKPWKAPSGGDDCEICNNDPLKPCSEYRCNSLGAACEIVNKGTSQEMCESSHDDEIPPIISPQLGVISNSESYSNISDSGLSITSEDGGCVDAYSQLMFGITTDELSYCKFDVEEKEFENMEFDFGGNAYLYNHTTPFVLPDPSHGQSQGSDWTGDVTLYAKCVDTYGHETPNFYTIDMCVNEGPDTTAPVIRATYPTDDGIVSFNTTTQNITFVTNELSTCRWDSSDVDYFLMNNSMVCTDTLIAPSNPMGYACTDTVPVIDTENTYYIKCMDQPWLNDTDERNPNVESFVYTVRKPDKKITIDSIEPSQDFEVATDMTTIELQVYTSGGGEWHYCSYSFSGYDNMIEMFETGERREHTQPLNRPAGKHSIYIQCKDETGDTTQDSTEFEIFHDTSAPQISRVWQESSRLHLITTGTSECKYSTTSCQFDWDGAESIGTSEEHVISAIRGETYYVRCMDEFGNAPSGCSISTKIL